MAATNTAPDGRPEVRAEARWLRIAPRKARLVVEHIRGRTVPEARTVLAFTDRAAAREVDKVLRSAVANAEANHGLVGDELVVAAAYVDEGPVMKRWRARARGRAARIRKRTCHITLKLTTPAGTPTAEPPKRSRLPRKAADAEPQATGEAAEKATRRRSAKAESAQAGEPAAAGAEEAVPEQQPARTGRKKED